MSMNPLSLWVLIFLLSLVFLIKRKIEVGKGNKQLPPGPPKLPIIGNLHQLGRQPHRSLWQLSKRYGPVMFLQYGAVPTVVISSAEAAEEVLKIHDIHCCSRPALAGAGKLSYNFSDISFSPYGEYWRQIRKICVLELFSIKRVQSFRFIREEEVTSLINSISQASASATPVSLTEKLTTLVTNITFRMAFATNFEATDFAKDRFRILIDDAMSLLGSFSANDYFQHVGWIIDRITGYHARAEKVFQDLDTFYQQIIDEHLERGGTINKGQDDIVDVLLKIERDQARIGSIQFTKNHIKAVLMDLFFAGVTTGSDTLTWAMAELVRKPKVMARAQEEVRNVIGKKERVTESDINELHYLEMVIKETLRLHPPAPLLLPRETMSKFKINDYEIYPKMLIQVNVWAIGRDPKYWKNPEEFLPERFMDSSIDFKGQNFEFLPFGGGRRSCPGQYMGTILLELVLANLLYFFDWRLPNDVTDINMEEKDGPSLTVSKMEALELVPLKYL
ncbi:cytochrome P450 71B36 [Ricinus communis]|uniref:Cytochrome P450, putative n=1 Tax=Ricinus communis TaxID=3988 RepID=B9SVN9_RICCO|nr:cytochrome P450 71B36 [Ricinus communis]EEF32358.1 cytochrome P450, putative [Ricinus communis]|eukprot:XP_002530058.1 cytochrome P450 71B36 [Ricinus communis]